MIRLRTLATSAAAALLALGTGAFAAPVTVDFSSDQSLHGHGSFTGTAVYDSTTDRLTLDITNTSKAALTAFAFEVQTGDAGRFERPLLSPWKGERNNKGIINAKPYGKYEGGAGVHGTWGSTAAKLGIAAGQSSTFVFDITGANASSLTTANFFTGTHPQIVASFSGFKKTHFRNDRASGFGTVVKPDITNTTITTNTINPVIPPPNPVLSGGPIIHPIGAPGSGPAAVPLPPAFPAGLAMLGIFGLVHLVRRFRKISA